MASITRVSSVIPPPLLSPCAIAAKTNQISIANIVRFTNPYVSVREEVQLNGRPALLICGSRERRFADHREFAAVSMPLLDIVDIDAGHGMNMEAHEAFNTAACDFIACHT